MNRNFTNENLERFLRRNADGLRMQPSDKVWEGISSHLNRRRKIFGFSIGLGLMLTTALGYYFTDLPNTRHGIKPSVPVTAVATQSVNAGSSSKLDTRIYSNSKEVNTADVVVPALHTTQFDLTLPFLETNIIPLSESTFNETTSSAITNSTIVDSYVDQMQITESTTSNTHQTTYTGPMTIESVMNAYQRKYSKLGLQLYFTPSMSYRKLNDANIDNVVMHKPDFGFEIGMTAKYKISKNLKIRAGVQFNVNRYAIKTYNATTQLATIRLNNRFGFDSLNTPTNYNNFGGYEENWIENFSFQVSAPVGLEMILKENENVQFGVASTIQPTYVVGERAYLISSDYKNYAEVPRLTRRMNVNTSLETFVGYSTGRLKWQVGPQVRYQLLSSYVKKYPVKENLFDFGLKVGISLNNQ